MKKPWGRAARFLYSALIEVYDAIIPPKERALRTKQRSLEDVPLAPRNFELLGETITVLTNYRRSEVRDLIRSLKYDGSEYAARLCAAILADYLREEILTLRAFSPRPILLIPLPLHPTRQRERGFNQISLVLSQLPVEMQNGSLALLTPHALIRARATPRQTTFSRRERIHNMKGAFLVPDHSSVAHASIFLIDDVTTTGATLKEAAKPLRAAGASVYPIALARA
ncbi:MAG TPA: hypothetical protein VMU27_03470 [Candidatus Paceibacterota bacterium]|nr:hypothetical protein [Candidatus Paceibacterota bacterium]